MRVAVTVFLQALLLATTAAAQQPYGSLGGRVVGDRELPLPGVAVSLSGPAMQGSRTVATDANGRYRFAPVPPGAGYLVGFELDGFAPVGLTGVIVNVGRETTADASMAPAQFAETVEVSAERIVVDTTKSTVDTTVEWKLADVLATDRGFQSLMQLAPGVQVNAGDPRVHGGSRKDNQYLIDGVNTTDPRNEGFGTYINYDTIAEAQVQTAGFAADYGRVVGGIINLVTKSGGNEMHGSLRYVQRDEDWIGEPAPGREAVRTYPTNFRDASATLGGPFQRDRLWYFAAYERTEGNAGFPRATDPSNTTTYQDSADSSGHAASVKLTWQPTVDHQLVAWYNEDPGGGTNLAGFNNSGVAPEADQDMKWASRTTTLQWTGVASPASFVEARLSTYWIGMKILPAGTFGPEPSFDDYATGYVSGTTDFTSDMDYYRDSAVVAWNRTFEAGSATHQLKAGVDGFVGDSTDFDVNCPSGGLSAPGECIGLVDGQPDDRTVFYNRGGSFTDENSSVALYLQDSWRIGDLTLNLGLRAETLELTGNTGKTVADFGLADQLAPRLGFAWSIGGHSLHGSASRFYDLVDGGLTYLTNETAERVAYYWWGPAYDLGEGWVEVADFPLNSGNAADPALAPPYTDELTLGYDHRVSDEVAASITLIWREQKDAIESVDAGVLGDQVADDGSFYFTNVPGLWKRYRAVELAVKKRLSADRLQLLASWTHAFANDGYSTNSQISGWGDSSVSIVNRWGRTDSDDLLKAAGSYAFPFRLTVGFFAYYYSGPVYHAYTRAPTPKGRYPEFLEPSGSREVGSQWSVDLHVEQGFAISKDVVISVYADAFNVTDNQDPTARSGLVDNAATFGQPTAWQPPRRYQVGAKVEF